MLVRGLLALALCHICQSADVTVCPGNATVFASDKWSFNNVFLPNSDCTYMISFKANTAAYITTSVQELKYDGDVVVVENRFAGGISLRTSNLVKRDIAAFYPPGAVYLHVTTSANSTATVSLSLAVVSSTKDAVIKSTDVIAGQQPITIAQALQLGTTFVYNSQSSILLEIVSSEDKISYFDSVFVYIGSGVNAVLTGTLNDHRSMQSFDIGSRTLTLYPVGNVMEYGMIIINNEANVAQFNMANMATYWSFYSTYPDSAVYFESNDGLASVSVVNWAIQSQFPIITYFEFTDPTAVISVYAGLPCSNMATYKIADYTNATTFTSLPQMFPGTAVTFTINKGSARIDYTTMAHQNDTDWGKAIIGKKGLFISEYYGFNTDSQTQFLSTLSSDRLADRSIRQFTVGKASGMDSADSWMNYAATNETDGFVQTNVTAPGSRDFSIVGKNLIVDWSAGKAASFGQILSYSVDPVVPVTMNPTTAAMTTMAPDGTTMNVNTIKPTANAPMSTTSFGTTTRPAVSVLALFIVYALS